MPINYLQNMRGLATPRALAGPTLPNYTSVIGGPSFLSAKPPGATLAGDVAPGYTPAFGGKPTVPNPAATAGQATEGNIFNYPRIAGLTQQVDAGNLANVLTNVGANIPNYTGLTAARSQNIADQLAGVVPVDVQNLLQNRAAELGVAGGFPGSQAVDFADLASLGLTSIGQKEKGMAALGSALSTMPNVPLMDPTSGFVTPSDIQGAQYASNVIGAAPDPTTASETAFQRMLQLRELDAAQQEAMAERDFARMAQLEALRARLNPRTTGTPQQPQPASSVGRGLPAGGFDQTYSYPAPDTRYYAFPGATPETTGPLAGFDYYPSIPPGGETAPTGLDYNLPPDLLPNSPGFEIPNIAPTLDPSGGYDLSQVYGYV